MTPDPHDRFFKGKAFEALEALVRSGADDLTYLRTALTYLSMVSGDIDKTEFQSQIEGINDQHLKEESMSIAELLKSEGRQEGRQEGQFEGERLLLERQLTRKFGELSYYSKEKLDQADRAALDLWGERILEAKTLDELFGV